MDFLQMTLAMQDPRHRLAQSALPDAPVVTEARPLWSTSRATFAGLLRRVADAVAPSEFTPAGRPTLSTGGRAC